MNLMLKMLPAKEVFDMRARLYLLTVAFLLSITASLFASDYFEYSKKDMDLAEPLLKKPEYFHKYVMENRVLNSARIFLRNGQKFNFLKVKTFLNRRMNRKDIVR